MNTYCELSVSHKCENEAGLKHFIKHGVIQGCAGCCKYCLNKDTCEYRCAYVKGAPPSPAPQDKAVTTVPAADVAAQCGNAPAAPSFDFSPLGELSAQAAEADQQFDLHYGTAQDEYLISCIYLARIHALTAKAGRYGGGTWTKWCESKKLGEGSVRRMIQNGDAFNSATLAELKQLPNLTRKDLNLIARSGCADQLVQAAGNDQRVQELLDQLKAKDDALAAEKSRADTAEHHLDAARADVQGLTEQNHQLQQRADAAEAREEEAWSQREKAEQHAKDAEQKLEGSRQVASAAALRADKLKAENDALKSQPITAVVDKEEVRRQAEEMAAGMTADLRAQLDKTAADTEQDARDAYDSILMAGRSMHNSWQTVRPLFRKLPEQQREAAANQLVQTLAAIQGEVSRCL
nr:MAG TPA_asm: hypothetical protein [Caudoviricetes sp.]